jgi:hypothetical protein
VEGLRSDRARARLKGCGGVLCGVDTCRSRPFPVLMTPFRNLLAWRLSNALRYLDSSAATTKNFKIWWMFVGGDVGHGKLLTPALVELCRRLHWFYAPIPIFCYF